MNSPEDRINFPCCWFLRHSRQPTVRTQTQFSHHPTTARLPSPVTLSLASPPCAIGQSDSCWTQPFSSCWLLLLLSLSFLLFIARRIWWLVDKAQRGIRRWDNHTFFPLRCHSRLFLLFIIITPPSAGSTSILAYSTAASQASVPPLPRQPHSRVACLFFAFPLLACVFHQFAASPISFASARSSNRPWLL